MSDLLTAARPMREATDWEKLCDAQVEFVHDLAYATADELRAFVNESALLEDDEYLPPWLRRLILRLAVLQAPDDPNLLRWTAQELYRFGPRWDQIAAHYMARAELLDPGGKAHLPL